MVQQVQKSFNKNYHLTVLNLLWTFSVSPTVLVHGEANQNVPNLVIPDQIWKPNSNPQDCVVKKGLAALEFIKPFDEQPTKEAWMALLKKDLTRIEFFLGADDEQPTTRISSPKQVTGLLWKAPPNGHINLATKLKDQAPVHINTFVPVSIKYWEIIIKGFWSLSKSEVQFRRSSTFFLLATCPVISLQNRGF